MSDVAEAVDRMTLSEAEFHLPPEVWEQIFRYLKGQQLLKVRLVCHRWKAIVDRKRSLWTEMKITTLPVFSTDAQPLGEVMPPAPAVSLRSKKIETVNSWLFGKRLTSIRLFGCDVTLKALVEMLRHCPNLVRLHLDLVTFTCTKEPDVVDFQLVQMEELELIGYAHVFDVYLGLFPHLRKLVLDCDLSWRDSVENEARFISTVQRTLECLQFSPIPYLLQRMAEMTDLRLKQVHLLMSREQNAVELSRLQPSLEEMIMPNWCMSSSSLAQIGRHLPRLKLLTTQIELSAALEPTFLTTMSRIEILNIMSVNDMEIPINLCGYKCPKLVDLSLGTFNLDTSTLRDFADKSKNLRKLTLSDCTVNSWIELFRMVADIPLLRYLNLWYSRAKHQLDIPLIRPTNLDCLLLNASEGLTGDILVQVCMLSPGLEELTLWSMPNVDDSTLLQLCRWLPRLARLKIGHCSVTAACAEPLLDTCKALRKLDIAGCEAFHAAVQKLLRLEGGGDRYIELVRRSPFSFDD